MAQSEESAKTNPKMANQMWKIYTPILGGIFVVLAVLIGLGLVYSDRILPSLKVGQLDLSGKSEAEVRVELGTIIDQLTEAGITVNYQRGQGQESTIVPVESLVDLDVAVAGVLNYGKEGNIVRRGWQVLVSLFGQAEIPLPGIFLTEEAITELVKKSLTALEQPAKNADFKVISTAPFKYEVSTSSPGVVFNYTAVGKNVLAEWENARPAKIEVVSQIDQPEVSEVDINAIASSTASVFVSPIVLKHYDEHTKRSYQWSISKQQLADWSEVKRNETGVYLAISTEAIADFVSGTVKSVVDKEPANASFTLNTDGTKATKFVGARPGVTVDLQATEQGIEKVFAARLSGESATSTQLVIATVQPKIKTEDTNDLGIKEILGYGTSYFSGSPRNRILNIKNAVVNKLNGTIVKPGEEFSMVNTLKPFTLEAGYLPELVILGNRITPEIAGGLCQVGTTMFRAAMNSGLNITARTNHGLVVSYYNDLSNGKPGTDATIYEPNPDFRFRNDTGNNILISTEMNVATGELTFYVWGTNDGRKAYFTPPQVLSWIPAGPAQTIETNDLAPGKKECQGVHPGAVTTFNYIRTLANGNKEVREFKSTYRAVPATCYVGRDPNAAPKCPEDNPNCAATPAPIEGTPVPVFDPASDLVPAN